MENVSTAVESDAGKAGGKGMLADLLEREVKKEPVNGAAPSTGKELRISDNGLELVQNDGRARFAVDMGVVGMNDLGVDLGDGAAAPKAAHLIAQVDDSGHVQIHLEEEAGGALCNGQSLLDQLEACEVSSSTDHPKAVKRMADIPESNETPPVKKPSINHVNNTQLNDSTGGVLEKAIEMALTTEQNAVADKTKEKIIVNGNVNGLADASGIVSVNTSTTASPANPTLPPLATATVLGPNTPRTFLIPQQQSPQQARLGFPVQQGQRLLLAIQRPGGVIQHVAMPANVVAITSSQLQTNGAVVTVTNSIVGAGNNSAINYGTATPVSLSTSGCLSAPSTVLVTSSAQPITTVASTVSSVVTTASMEGVVTFSGGAVAFPARPTENAARTSNLAESHVTITPVPASSIVNPASAVTTSAPAVVSTTPAAVTTANPAVKKRTNSSEPVKPRGRPIKSKSIDGNPVSSPSPQPVDPSLQYLCEWKDCMR